MIEFIIEALAGLLLLAGVFLVLAFAAVPAALIRYLDAKAAWYVNNTGRFERKSSHG